MTDAWLMEADCIHGVAWYECLECEQPEPPRTAEMVAQGQVWVWLDGRWEPRGTGLLED